MGEEKEREYDKLMGKRKGERNYNENSGRVEEKMRKGSNIR